jgi:serine/threonine-protein kinase
MIDGRGQVRITDFGLASLAAELGPREAMAGTPAYMAPEQFEGKPVSIQSDLYSLGLVLYEVYTGKAPVESGAISRSEGTFTTSTPSAPSSFVGNLDPVAERAILRCLERDPTDRPVSALSVAAALPGGDPLAAALAAGETPSPELVAEAGRSEAMRPAVAMFLAATAIALFLVGARWVGSLSMYDYLPMNTSPAVFVDQAHTVLEGAGYTEPVYEHPVDRSWGFNLWGNIVNRVRDDSRPDSWSGLRDTPEAMSFWYRQSPSLYRPGTNTPNSFTSGMVRIVSPVPTTSGEVTVMFDLARRLQRLEVLPKRYSTLEGEPPSVDWSFLFAQAELDPDRFVPTRPRYRRFLAPDRTWAWLGTRAEAPADTLRVEAGSFEGRPVLFQVASQEEMATLGAEPEARRPFFLELNNLQAVIPFVLIVLGGIFARRNMLRGRSDRRGALRLGVAYAVLDATFEVLRSHVVYHSLFEAWKILGTAVFYGVFVAILYLALEPYARQVWPSMLVSTSRLLSRAQIRWRDPLLGRSVLLGLLIGSALYLFQFGFVRWLAPHVGGRAWWPYVPDLDALVSQRQAVAWSMWALIRSIAGGMLLAFLVTTMRAITRRRVLALVLAGLIWTVGFGGSWGWMTAFSFVSVAVQLTLLLRAGLVSMLVAFSVMGTGMYAMTDDWSAWYSQTAVTCLVFVVALALYGVWASRGSSPKGAH